MVDHEDDIDCVLRPDVLDYAADRLKVETPLSVADHFAQTYEGHPDMSHLICSWIEATQTPTCAMDIVADKVFDMLKACFKQKGQDRLDRAVFGARQSTDGPAGSEPDHVPDWLHHLSRTPEYANKVLELYAEHSDCLTLEYLVRQYAVGTTDAVTPAPKVAALELRSFGRVLWAHCAAMVNLARCEEYFYGPPWPQDLEALATLAGQSALSSFTSQAILYAVVGQCPCLQAPLNHVLYHLDSSIRGDKLTATSTRGKLFLVLGLPHVTAAWESACLLRTSAPVSAAAMAQVADLVSRGIADGSIDHAQASVFILLSPSQELTPSSPKEICRLCKQDPSSTIALRHVGFLSIVVDSMLKPSLAHSKDQRDVFVSLLVLASRSLGLPTMTLDGTTPPLPKAARLPDASELLCQDLDEILISADPKLRVNVNQEAAAVLLAKATSSPRAAYCALEVIKAHVATACMPTAWSNVWLASSEEVVKFLPSLLTVVIAATQAHSQLQSLSLSLLVSLVDKPLTVDRLNTQKYMSCVAHYMCLLSMLGDALPVLVNLIRWARSSADRPLPTGFLSQYLTFFKLHAGPPFSTAFAESTLEYIGLQAVQDDIATLTPQQRAQ
eukprot:gene9649-1736_t